MILTMPYCLPAQIWIARNPPGFAFIDYEDFRDAEDAVRKLDGEFVMFPCFPVMTFVAQCMTFVALCI